MVINESLVEFTTIVHIVHDKQKGAILLMNQTGECMLHAYYLKSETASNSIQ
jgi:hypothetical protein